MEKKEMIELYVAPEVEVLEVQVEKGFVGSVAGSSNVNIDGGASAEGL